MSRGSIEPSPLVEGDAQPVASFLPKVNVKGSLHDLVSACAWRNPELWRAGANLQILKHLPFHSLTYIHVQVIEGIASAILNFVSGLLVTTLSTWRLPAVPVGILFGNMILVSTLISAIESATGSHVNSMVTHATTFSGHCHPICAIIYILCQLGGDALGGFLRVALGSKLAYAMHNVGCWIEPAGWVFVKLR